MFKRTQQTLLRDITPKEAEAFLKLNDFPGQRPLNQLKARQYCDFMENGTMRPVDVAVMTMPNGIKHLANGQHVLTGIIKYGNPFPARIDYYKCETETDAWHLFSTFDTHASRTDRHIAKAARGLLENEAMRTIPLRVLSSCAAALFYVNSGKDGRPDFTARPNSKTEKVDGLNANDTEVLEAAFIIGPESNGNNPLTRVGVVAAIIMSAKANAKSAHKFWEAVRTGENLTRSHPAYKLREWLREPVSRHMSNDGARGNHMIQYIVCISWWNSFVTNQPRTSVKVSAMKEIPAVIG